MTRYLTLKPNTMEHQIWKAGWSFSKNIGFELKISSLWRHDYILEKWRQFCYKDIGGSKFVHRFVY